MDRKVFTEALNAIDFEARYRRICALHASRSIDTKPGKEIVLPELSGLGYKAKYHRGEDFYQVEYVEYGQALFDCKLDVRHGLTLLLCAFLVDGEVNGSDFSGEFEALENEQLRKAELEKEGGLYCVQAPQFESVDEFKVALRELMDLYEDLKSELIRRLT